MNYEPLIERDLDAIPAAAQAYLQSHTAEELWTSVTRFAVLAYAPSQHLKRAVMACHAAWVLRRSADFVAMIIECARYAAEARQPWSEPPLLDPPSPSSPSVDELRAAARSGDRLRAERWLSAALPEAHDALRDVVHGDARLMLDAAIALEPLLGEKGRYALLRMPVWELVADPGAADPSEPFDVLLARAVASRGAVDSVRDVLLRREGFSPPPPGRAEARPALCPYRLARDYAQTLLVHAFAPHPGLLQAVHDNLEHGESYADWSFA
ncbi:MAG TPA: hypothetical protein VM733_07910 [Thermoanaerobaculia bacterium]|nr:hypothetical protein [Thermoanaerobaculia bacterium]